MVYIKDDVTHPLLGKFSGRLGQTFLSRPICGFKILHSMNPQHLSIEYVPYGNSDLQTYRLTLRSQETIYSGLINEHEFSSTYLELKDLDKVFRDENLGVSGLTSMVKYTENYKENIVVIEFELTFQRAAKTKRATEHYRLQVHKIERDLQLERITKLEVRNSSIKSL